MPKIERTDNVNMPRSMSQPSYRNIVITPDKAGEKHD